MIQKGWWVMICLSFVLVGEKEEALMKILLYFRAHFPASCLQLNPSCFSPKTWAPELSPTRCAICHCPPDQWPGLSNAPLAIFLVTGLGGGRSSYPPPKKAIHNLIFFACIKIFESCWYSKKIACSRDPQVHGNPNVRTAPPFFRAISWTVLR